MSESENEKAKTTVRIEKDRTQSTLVYLRETAGGFVRRWRESHTIEGEAGELSELNHACERLTLALGASEHAPAVEVLKAARELTKLFHQESAHELGMDVSRQADLVERLVRSVDRLDGIR